jgi:hypothetical protein
VEATGPSPEEMRLTAAKCIAAADLSRSDRGSDFDFPIGSSKKEKPDVIGRALRLAAVKRFGSLADSKLTQVRERRENVFPGCCRDDLASILGDDPQPQIGEVEANEEFPLSLIVRPVDFPDQAFQR